MKDISFRLTDKGNWFAEIEGKPVTVFKGKFGGWAYFLDGEFSGEWFPSDGAAKASVVLKARRPLVPACISFFGLTPPVRRNDLMARYRELARQTHPDHGGTCEAFKQVQAAFESALTLVGGAA